MLFGYVDCNSFYRYGLFVCAVTADLVVVSLSAGSHSTGKAVFLLVSILTLVFIGPIISCFIAVHTNNRRIWFACISGFAICVGVVLDLYDWHNGRGIRAVIAPNDDEQFLTGQPYLFLLLTTSFGAMIHWSLKIPYPTMFMTINMHRMSEAISYLNMARALSKAVARRAETM
jgi:uncharacterized membrane protein YoaK (UPF0700 family)